MAAWRVDRQGEDDDEGKLIDLGRFRAPERPREGQRSMAEIWGFGPEVAEAAAPPARRGRFWAREDVEDEEPAWAAPPARRAFSASEIEALASGTALPRDPDDDAVFVAEDDLAPGDDVFDDAPPPPPARQPTDRKQDWRAWEIDGGATPAQQAPPVAPAPATAVASTALAMQTTVRLGEALRLCTQLAERWGAGSKGPTPRDLVVRAFARAIQQQRDVAELGDALVIVELEGRIVAMETAALAQHPLRTNVAAFQREEHSGTAVFGAVYDFAPYGLEYATPRLGEGVLIAIAIGSPRFVPVQAGAGMAWSPAATLALAYDGTYVDDLSAALILRNTTAMLNAVDTLLDPAPTR